MADNSATCSSGAPVQRPPKVPRPKTGFVSVHCRLPETSLLVGLLLGFLVVLGTVCFPFDPWWAGSVWSRPSPLLWGGIVLYLVLVGCCTALLFRSGSARGEPSVGQNERFPRRVPWHLLVPAVFFFYSLALPSKEALGDPINLQPGAFSPSSSSPGAGLYALGWMALGGGNPAARALCLRVGLALLGALRAWGLFLLLRRALGRSRGPALAVGLTFSFMSAQFVGYFEPSGMVSAFLPFLVLLIWRGGPAGRLGVAIALLAIALSGVWHGAALCLAPAIGLAPFFRREKGRRLSPIAGCCGGAILTCVGVLGALGLARLVRYALGQSSLGFLQQTAGGDNFPLVALTPTQLDLYHFTHYLVFTREWLWEHVQFLAVAGPGIVAILLIGIPCLVRARASVLPLGAGVLGASGLFLFWGFDWGMVRDWNLAGPCVEAAALLALLAGRARIRRLSLSACGILAVAIAWPGIALVLHHHTAGPEAHLPDAGRWERTTGGGRTLYVAGEGKRWVWRTVGEPVEFDGVATARVWLTPVRRSVGMVDRLEWRPVAPNTNPVVTTEAEKIPNLAPYAAELDGSGCYDGLWGVTRMASASGGWCANALRREPPATLEWQARPPAGAYQFHIRLYQHAADPVGLLQVLRFEVRIR